MEKEIKIWDNVLIRFEDVESIPMVQFFWDTIGVETSFALLGGYYYMGVPKPINDTINVNDLTVLSFEEAVEIYNKQNKTFPREMYVWDNDIKCAKIRKVVYSCNEEEWTTNKFVTILPAIGLYCFMNAMEIEEYEAMMNKEKENTTLKEWIKKMESLLLEAKPLVENELAKFMTEDLKLVIENAKDFIKKSSELKKKL